VWFAEENLMIVVSKRSIAVAMLAALFLQSQAAYSQIHRTPTAPPMAHEGGERHPTIHRAINALEAAKAYIESAAHDFCGHRAAALAESNLALNQLGLAISCDKRKDSSAGPRLVTPGASATLSAGSLSPERHPLIRQAISALQAARHDFQGAVHDYCGHRVEALEAVNRTLTQLKLALDCDKD
jgi:hypothetical protein